MSMSQHSVRVGSTVTVKLANGNTTRRGIVQQVLPRTPNDPPGTKVRLQSGEVGHVQSVEQ